MTTEKSQAIIDGLIFLSIALFIIIIIIGHELRVTYKELRDKKEEERKKKPMILSDNDKRMAMAFLDYELFIAVLRNKLQKKANKKH